MKQPDKNDNNYDTLWKMKTPSDQQNDTYAKFYMPSEHLAADEVTGFFKGRATFKQDI
jgi:hypothetical protein